MDWTFHGDDAAVSPVISTILMVAVAVVLSAVIATFAFSYLGSVSETPPQATFAADQSADGTLTLRHVSGDSVVTDRLYIKYDTGRLALSDLTGEAKLTAGDELSVPGPVDGQLDVIYEAPDTSATLASLDTSDGAMYADTFCTDTSSDYDETDEDVRGSDSFDFQWHTGDCLLESDESNDDLSATWATDVTNPDEVRVATRARTADNDAVGVVITTAGPIQYEAVVTDDYPDGSGIYERSPSGTSLASSDRVAATTNSYTAQGTWHRVALTYNGTHLRMFVDGTLEATKEVAITPERAGIVSLANDPAAEYEYLSVYSE